MFRTIGTLIVVCGITLGTSELAEAHGMVYNRHDAPRHYHGDLYRHRAMPRWLWKKNGFASWYYHSPLRFNNHLAWWQLYEIYRWERRYDRRHHYRGHYGPRHRDYDWYRSYWREYEHRERRHGDRRHRDRRRHHNRD